MAFEHYKTELNMLLAQLAERPHDRAELEIMLREKLNELRAFGMPLPADLVDLEAAIDEQLAADAWRESRDGEQQRRS